MKGLRNRTGAGLLMWLFISYYVSTTTFVHTHYFAWGMVTHSHPYNPFGDSPLKHNHTQAECLHIASLSHFASTAVAMVAVCFVAAVIRVVLTPALAAVRKRCSLFLALRAPPIV